MVTKAQIKATTKYESEHYDKVLVRIPKGHRSVWKGFAECNGTSLNQFIVNCVNEQIRRGDDGKLVINFGLVRLFMNLS